MSEHELDVHRRRLVENRQRGVEWTGELGPPIFVPAGHRFSAWTFGGAGRHGTDAVSQVDAGVYAWQDGWGFVVTTSVGEDRNFQSRVAASHLLSKAVPEDVSFPYTATVSEFVAAVSMEGRSVDGWQVLECNGQWRAHGFMERESPTSERASAQG